MSIRFISFFAALCLLQVAHATMPGVISFQGRALTATGELMGSGTSVTRTVIFRIWDHPTNSLAANLVYSEQQIVTIAEGEFSVLVGSGAVTAGTPLGYSEADKGQPLVNIIDAFGGTSRYLGVTINDGTAEVSNEISPRQQIVSGAFSLRSMQAGSFGGELTLDMFETGSVESNKIAAGAITWEKIAASGIGTDIIAEGAFTNANIP